MANHHKISYRNGTSVVQTPPKNLKQLQGLYTMSRMEDFGYWEGRFELTTIESVREDIPLGTYDGLPRPILELQWYSGAFWLFVKQWYNYFPIMNEMVSAIHKELAIRPILQQSPWAQRPWQYRLVDIEAKRIVVACYGTRIVYQQSGYPS